jgi:DNA-binding transcriptional LysR family regulator
VAVVTTAKYFVPRLLGEFSLKHSGIDVALEVVNRDVVLERLAANMDDLYVMDVPPPEMNLTIEPFMENPLVIIAPQNHELAGKTKIPLKRLEKERFIQRENGSGTRLASTRFFEERGIMLNVKMELGNNEAIMQGVAGGLGLAVLSQHAVGAHPSDSSIVVLDVQDFPIKRSWYIVRPEGKRLSVVAQAFHDYLLAARSTIK